MSGLGELLNDCVGVVMSVGLVLIVACCIAPIARVLGATGRKRRKKRSRRSIGIREGICLALAVILLIVLTANGTISAMISSRFRK